MRKPLIHAWGRAASLLVGLALLLGLAAPAAAADSWWQKDWPFRKEITLDATPKGGDIAQPAGRVALLIRLDSGNFKFSDANEKGNDLRFVAADGKTPLAYDIESFDPLLGLAAIWVDVPEFPAGTAKKIWMYYGNKKATPSADSGAVFDPNYGLVYHFGQPAGAPPTDATANHVTATAASTGVDEGSVIGKGAKFTGQGGVTIPDAPSLALAAGGPFSFSAWVKPGAPQARAALYVRRTGGSALIVGLDQGTPFVEVNGQHAQGPRPLAPNQWAHIAVTADGKTVTLYQGGQPVATLAAALPALSGPTSLGADLPGGNLTPFVGGMDEARISKVARSPVLIRVDASTQGAQSKLVAYGQDQKQAGIGFGSLGLIVTHVDAPAWFIIGLLSILALASWWVIARKVAYVNGADKANDRFLEFFHAHGGEPVTLDRHLQPGEFDESSIYRVYHAGAQEMAARAKRGQYTVTAEGVEVVRSLMNTRLVRENQALAKNLVVLTIAISGGPFLGLLGTVVGVMITFADIAAAGDVNINAIAPGISAALLATIAGLAVAIPALFAYNYILLRNKDVSSNMLVFVDEFITRISEMHREGGAHPLAAE